jgi:hypothetical protein
MKQLTKFPIRKQLRAVHIVNSTDVALLLPSQKVWLAVQSAQYGRVSNSASVQVVGINSHHTDKKAAWYDYGKKTFIIRNNEDKPRQLRRAKMWVGTHYGRRSWIRDPFGNWHDARILPLVWKVIHDDLRS